MATNITFDPYEAVSAGIVDVSSSARIPIHNGEDCRADAIQAVERAAQFLTARRKMCCSGNSRYETSTSTFTTRHRIARDGYTKQVEISIFCSLTGATSDDDYMTVNASSTTDGTGKDVIVQNQTETTVEEAKHLIIVLNIGAGDETDLGAEYIDISYTLSNDGTIRVFDTGFEPVDMIQITVP